MKNYKIISIFNLIFIIHINQNNCQIHDYMTEDEVRQIFYTTQSNASIPEYETVKLIHDKTIGNLSSTNYTQLSFTAFGEKKIVKLKLYESTLIGYLTPIWLAKYDFERNRVLFDKLKPFILGDEVTLFETPEGSLIGRGIDENGVPYFAGRVGNITISPITSNLSREIQRRKRDNFHNSSSFINEDLSDEYVVTDYHIIYKMPQSFHDNLIQSATIKTENLINKFKQQNDSVELRKGKREIFENDTIIYPEILLYTDFTFLFLQAEGPIFHKFIIYLIAFWNNVALYFKTLTNPTVSLRITGIVISTMHHATPFLNNRVSQNGNIFSLDALFEMGDWLMRHKNIFPIDTYDFGVAMTNRKLCEKNTNTNTCKTSTTIGVANIEAKCAFNTFIVEMCAIIHDNLDFSGVVTATHELAHLMGAQHSGVATVSTRDCDKKDLSPQYIMTPYASNTPRNFIWSNCTKQILSRGWWRGSKDCLKLNSTLHTGKTVSIILPGDTISLEKQCINRGYAHACDPTSDTCNDLQCWTSGFMGLFSGWRCRKSGAPLNGSNCGPNRFCILGKCTSRND